MTEKSKIFVEKIERLKTVIDYAEENGIDIDIGFTDEKLSDGTIELILQVRITP